MFSSLTSLSTSLATPPRPWASFSVSILASAAIGNITVSPYYDWASSSDGTYLLMNDVNRRAQLSNDAGLTWTILFSSAVTPRSVAVSATGQYMAVGTNSSTIYHSSDYGASFKTLTTSGGPANGSSHSIKISDDGDTVISGTSAYSGLYRTANAKSGTQTWTRYTTTIRVYSCFMSRDATHLYYHADGSNFYTSTDSAATWTTGTWAGGANSAYRCAAADDLSVLISNCWAGVSVNKIQFTNAFPGTQPADINVSNFLKSGNLTNSGQVQTPLCSRALNSKGYHTLVIFETGASSDSVLYSRDSGTTWARFGSTPFDNGSNFITGCLSDNGNTLFLSSSAGGNTVYKVTFL
jgi:hypothetical protein